MAFVNMEQRLLLFKCLLLGDLTSSIFIKVK